jgi:hypothetical protein
LSYPSTILGREGAIVLNLEVSFFFRFWFFFLSISLFFLLRLFACFEWLQHIKAIITSEEVCGFCFLSFSMPFFFKKNWDFEIKFFDSWMSEFLVLGLENSFLW